MGKKNEFECKVNEGKGIITCSTVWRDSGSREERLVVEELGRHMFSQLTLPSAESFMRSQSNLDLASIASLSISSFLRKACHRPT